MKRLVLLGFVLILADPVLSQSAPDTGKRDTTQLLQEITIKAFGIDRSKMQTPASVATVHDDEFGRINPNTFVHAVNQIPGVRLEERSPGSYRVSIRGSTMRSPFGVRNVKVYWNDIPLTDAGGNTYLNQLDPTMTGTMEIVKGPGGSLYGAGTGGVLLLNSPVIQEGKRVKINSQIGSFASRAISFSFEESNKDHAHQVQYLRQQADGYREHTAMRRDVLNSVFSFNTSDQQKLETYLFYSNLFYETPGALTQSEYESNPRQARPATATLPGAAEQQAGVSLRSFYAGVAHEYHFKNGLNNRTSVYGNFVRFENPTIRNEERRTEQTFGARSVFDFDIVKQQSFFKILGGGEFQSGFSPIKTYENNSGNTGVLLQDDEVSLKQYSIFGQIEWRFRQWNVSAGLSFNRYEYTIERISPASINESILFDPEIIPRVNIGYTISKNVLLYGLISQGFSPPTQAEVVPSNGIVNLNLNAERGSNVEVGVKVDQLFGVVSMEVAAYQFTLDDAIVIRRDNNDAEFFLNAGSTRQRGIEIVTRATWNNVFIFKKIVPWITLTKTDHAFDEFINDQTDYSGKNLAGVSPAIWQAGLDMDFRNKLYLRAALQHVARTPLDDANSVYADAYSLASIRLGYSLKYVEIYGGCENVFDETYSLGHDLNAFGGRYFNAAYGRNFYFGLKIQLDLPKQ